MDLLWGLLLFLQLHPHHPLPDISPLPPLHVSNTSQLHLQIGLLSLYLWRYLTAGLITIFWTHSTLPALSTSPALDGWPQVIHLYYLSSFHLSSSYLHLLPTLTHSFTATPVWAHTLKANITPVELSVCTTPYCCSPIITALLNRASKTLSLRHGSSALSLCSHSSSARHPGYWHQYQSSISSSDILSLYKMGFEQHILPFSIQSSLQQHICPITVKRWTEWPTNRPSCS